MLGNITIAALIVYVVSILIALSIHEFMHAYVGYKLGDDTAEREGRLTLNPLSHIDPLMTIALPILTLITIGAPILAAKPVPFSPGNVKFDEFGAALIAAAGPLSNLALDIIGSIAFGFTESGSALQGVLSIFVILNVAVFVFNLIPIPPLDGSRVLYAFAPEPVRRVMEQIEPFGFFIIIFLVFLGGLGVIVADINVAVRNLLPFPV